MTARPATDEPAPPRRAGLRRCAGPAAVAAVAASGAALLFVRDPHRPGAYGLCPFHALTGLWCPGCGGMRAAHDLLHGDLSASLSSNVFVAPLVVVLAVAWVRWVPRRWRGGNERMIVVGPVSTALVLGALAAFTVLRNTPWGSGLAPG
ncbi:DUF2752 domain-containing protein [Rhodococcus triatomae]|nr:hypothetical protein G419_16308 [Rhodococcus triatomae BKS 15-14]